jgi:peptide/nickel transport system substrate-binding protein
MFEPLISADARGNPVPILAVAIPTRSNGGISNDGLTITYHLRRDARWSDGVPVTSKDVKWSWQAIMNPANNVVSRHGYDTIRDIATPNPSTVVVHLKAPFAPFTNTFFTESDQPFDVVPAHVLSKYENVNQIPFNTAPRVTDGPFRFVEWVHGDHLLLSANESFFMGAPKLRQIRVEVIPDEHTSIQLLRTHEIDYMFQASINTYRETKTIPEVRIVWDDMNGFQGIAFNLSHDPLRDPRVRIAIVCAIDKAKLVKTLTSGQEKMATEDLPDWMWAFNPNARPPSFDPARAKRLLAQAGFVTGGDGLLRRHGVPLRLSFVSDSADATHRKLIVLVQSMLRDVGVQADIKLYPLDVLYAAAAMGGIMHRGQFDLITYPWYSGIDPDNSSQFMCQNFPPYGYNDSRYCVPEMQKAQMRALAAYDRSTRRQAYFKIEDLLARDNPLIFLYWQRQQEVISVDFKGFAPNPTVESWNAWQWSI